MKTLFKRAIALILPILLCTSMILCASAATIPAEGSIWTPSANSSGGSGSASTYDIIVEEADNGVIRSNRRSAAAGVTVTVSAEAEDGYCLDTLKVTDRDGEKIALTKVDENTYTFKMPKSKVFVEGTFAEDSFELNFTDVPADAYYYDAVLWAVKNGITNGTSETTFSPDAPCTRAQMVTFLWRSVGSPEPYSTACPFTDVDMNSYYFEAVLWAVENGITNGTSETTFSPDMQCTRAQMATFLCRLADGKAESSTGTFVDVPAHQYYAEPVQWAVENGITYGTSETTFSPDATCTRAQMVTFLYRYLA